MSTLRRVLVFKYERQGNALVKVADGFGMFHGWGCDYEEFESGPGNFTAAIVERCDGYVELIHPSLIVFEESSV